jgi:Fur family ferric uptake transcriptional regulator
MSDWVDHTLTELGRAGYRRGGARTAVVEVLGRHSCARTALEIDDELRAEGRRVGRASVYRTLEQLDRLGLVSKVEVGHGTARYEPAHAGGEDHHHHHLVCDDCGNVLPFEDPDLERSIARLSRKLDFDVAEHDVVLHGSCGCRE